MNAAAARHYCRENVWIVIWTGLTFPVLVWLVLSAPMVSAIAFSLIFVLFSAVYHPKMLMFTLIAVPGVVYTVAEDIDLIGKIPGLAAIVGVILFVANFPRIVSVWSRFRVEYLLFALLCGGIIVSLIPNLIAGGSVKVVPWLVAAMLILPVAAVHPLPPRALLIAVGLGGAFASAIALALGHEVGGRLHGALINPNHIVVIAAPAFVATLALCRRGTSMLWLVPAAVCITALTATGSRGGVIAALVGSLCLFLRGPSPAGRTAFVLMLGSCGAICVWASGAALQLVVAALGRDVERLAASADQREELVVLAARLAVDNPILGIGYGNFPDYAGILLGAQNALNPHNEYLAIAAETGLLSLMAFLLLLWRGARNWGRGEFGHLVAVLVTWMTLFLFINVAADLGMSASFWITLGCLYASRGERGSYVCGPGRQE